MLQQLFDACQNISDFPAAVAAHFDDLYAMQDDFGQVPLFPLRDYLRSQLLNVWQ